MILQCMSSGKYELINGIWNKNIRGKLSTIFIWCKHVTSCIN
jgi:hypothetical protein